MNNTFIKSRAFIISSISVIMNIALSIFKFAAGYLGHSSALVADAIHSLSDVLSTIIVVIFLFVSNQKEDDNHQYGHQKFENLAALFLAIALGYIGIKIGYGGIESIRSKAYLSMPVPTTITIVAALVSIFSKEAMFHLTMNVAKKDNSSALKADAWHHRSDAFSSIGSLVGVIFARRGFPIMDSIASLIICIFILKTAIEIAIDSIKTLTDSACDPKTEDSIKEAALSVDGVHSIDLLKTRMFGSGFYVDIEIGVDENLSLKEAHIIASAVHDTIESQFPDAFHCMVHVNPISV